jgi:hypothetical protein
MPTLMDMVNTIWLASSVVVAAFLCAPSSREQAFTTFYALGYDKDRIPGAVAALVVLMTLLGPITLIVMCFQDRWPGD